MPEEIQPPLIKSGGAIPHRRRPRYSGKNPRKFHEKYKELNPEKYPDTVAKVIASGKTPAGTHRPIMVAEVLAALQPAPGLLAVDVTLGFGGHAAEILRRILPGGRLIGVDTDPVELPKTESRLRTMGFGAECLRVCASNYAGLPRVLAEQGVSGVDLLLADLGCSSMQLDDPARGFSFKLDGPLDMRMNPQKGQPASALLAAISESNLAALLTANADEPHAALIAAAIARARTIQPLTTLTLVTVIREALRSLPKSVQAQAGDMPVRRVFQALRIAVNEEFSALETFLRFLPGCLNPGGRAVVLTFHSGEDRRVKLAFQAGRRQGVYGVVSESVIRASPDEVHSNPRAASAKLRWAIRA
ncbi:MAG: 16S rRNA (cytosine(1402)-N(4))-methyltransferase RsmH [Verrucomicrobiota bacterium]